MSDKLSVLIVDDQDSFLFYQQEVLSSIGLDVITLQDPSQTLHYIERYDPDLLLLDKVMEIDGLVIAEEVMKSFEFLPVIIISASDDEMARKKAFTLGCIDYIRKDIDEKEFIKLIKDNCLKGHVVKSLDSSINTLDKSIQYLASQNKARGKHEL